MRNRISLIIIGFTLLIGLGVGLIAVRNQITVKNEALTLPIAGSCAYKVSRCEVDAQYAGGAFRIIVYEDGRELQPTGAPGQISVSFPASSDHQYYCKVVALADDGSLRGGADCAKTASGQPICNVTTPVPNSPTPFIPTTTVSLPSQSPTPAVPFACPQYDYNIILRPVTQ